MTRYDLLDIRAALDKASNWAHSQKDLFQMIDAKKKVEAMLNEPSLPGIEENGIPGKDFIPVEWVDACEMYGKWKIVKVEQPEIFDSAAFQKGVQEGRRLEREESVTDCHDLEEASEKYGSEYPAYNNDQFIAESAFKDGSKWQKRKMMEGAVEGVVNHGPAVSYVISNEDQLDERLKQFQNDAEVRIIILPKEEEG